MALEPVAAVAGVKVEIETPARAPVVNGERFLVFQALRNLVQNALEHAEKGSEIAISFAKGQLGWRVSVRNRGGTIPDYALGRLFEKFYSLEKPKSGKKSSGLGLSFAREVAILHGGEVKVANRDDGVSGVEASLAFSENPDLGR
ncbi:MAG: ATP-binding protein [Bdellovibrionia bacterium]